MLYTYVANLYERRKAIHTNWKNIIFPISGLSLTGKGESENR